MKNITLFRDPLHGYPSYRFNGKERRMNIQDGTFKINEQGFNGEIINNIPEFTLYQIQTADSIPTYSIVSISSSPSRTGGGGGRSGVTIYDHGTNLGFAKGINFTGAGVSTSMSAGVATVNIPGGISSTGTLNYIPKFTPDGNSLGNSLLYDNGTSVLFGGTTAIASAAIAMTSTSQGFLVPRMTTAQRNAIAAPATGLLVYNTSTSLFCYWDGAAWQNIDSQAGGDVSGSGTTNYVMKWTDGPNSVAGDSTIVDSGTSIYFGTVDKYVFDSTNVRASYGLNQTTITIGGTTYGTKLSIHNATATEAHMELHAASNTAAFGGILYASRSRGTFGTPLIVQDGDNIYDQYSVGYDGTDYAIATSIEHEVDGTPAANVIPGRILFRTATAAGTLTTAMRITSSQFVGIGVTPSATLDVAQAAQTTGAPTAFKVTTGAHTTLIAGNECIGVNYVLSATKQWATGAITTQREFLVQAPTYAFVGASTITTAATVAINGAPIAGTNATITNPLALWVQSGESSFVGSGTGNTTYAIRTYNSTPTEIFSVHNNGKISAGLVAGSMSIGKGSGFVAANAGNTFLGVNAGASLTTGVYHVALGFNALNSITSSTDCIAIGYNAQSNNQTSVHNIAIGTAALNALNSASTGENVAIGVHALSTNSGVINYQNTAIGAECMSNNKGGENVAIGYAALNGNGAASFNAVLGNYALNAAVASASENAVLGYNGGRFTTSGASNTYIGAYSGYTGTTGSSNVMLGWKSGYYETGSSKLFIDNQARANEAGGRTDALLYGEFNATVSSQILRVNASLQVRHDFVALQKGIDTTAGDSATINAIAGRFRKDATGTTFTLTNSYITANSILIITFASDPGATGNYAPFVTTAAGSATITFTNGAPTNNTDVNFFVIN